MSDRTVTLIDVNSDIYLENWTYRQRNPIGNMVRVDKRRIHGGPADGIDVIEVDDGMLRLKVLPTRGMSIWKGSYLGHPIGWNSPVRGPVHPSLVRPADEGGLGWLSGFDEFMVRCGLNFNGAPGWDEWTDKNGASHKRFLSLHGLIANQPARRVEVRLLANGFIEIYGVVDECSMFFPRLRLETVIRFLTEPGSFEIEDRVTNLGGTPVDLELLYHVNLGRPWIGPGAKFLAPIKKVAPRDAVAEKEIESLGVYPEPTAGVAEQVYFFELRSEPKSGDTAVALLNKEQELGCVLRYSTKQLPYFTLWKNPAAEADGYVTGLEPGTDFPNNRSVERAQGRLMTLEPGESKEFWVEMQFLGEMDDVSTIEKQIHDLQLHGKPDVMLRPNPDWSPKTEA
jgi:galactose mutarotase-like enzyme